MDDRAANQNSEATGKFSILDWPTPEMLQAANRARAKAVCDMILALGKWARASMANRVISKQSRDTISLCSRRYRIHLGRSGNYSSLSPSSKTGRDIKC
jgi:hypothetical protein